MLPDVLRQMPDSKLCIAKPNSPYIVINFITDTLWVGEMRPACPTHFPCLSVAVTALLVSVYGLLFCVPAKMLPTLWLKTGRLPVRKCPSQVNNVYGRPVSFQVWSVCG